MRRRPERALTEAPADNGGDDGVEAELGEELVAEVEGERDGETDDHGLKEERKVSLEFDEARIEDSRWG